MIATSTASGSEGDGAKASIEIGTSPLPVSPRRNEAIKRFADVTSKFLMGRLAETPVFSASGMWSSVRQTEESASPDAPLPLPIHHEPCGWNSMLPARLPKPQARGTLPARYAVVGAGYTGLAAARRLAELAPDAEIIVLEGTEVGEAHRGAIPASPIRVTARSGSRSRRWIAPSA